MLIIAFALSGAAVGVLTAYARVPQTRFMIAISACALTLASVIALLGVTPDHPLVIAAVFLIVMIVVQIACEALFWRNFEPARLMGYGQRVATLIKAPGYFRALHREAGTQSAAADLSG